MAVHDTTDAVIALSDTVNDAAKLLAAKLDQIVEKLDLLADYVDAIRLHAKTED